MEFGKPTGFGLNRLSFLMGKGKFYTKLDGQGIWHLDKIGFTTEFGGNILTRRLDKRNCSSVASGPSDQEIPPGDSTRRFHQEIPPGDSNGKST